MMRKVARVDDNQTEIVEALRRVGCSVQSLATVGNGCPDLLVGRQGVNTLLEVKDGSKPPSRRRLTPDEQIWQHKWGGQVVTVETVEQALKAVGVKTDV